MKALTNAQLSITDNLTKEESYRISNAEVCRFNGTECMHHGFLITNGIQNGELCFICGLSGTTYPFEMIVTTRRGSYMVKESDLIPCKCIPADS